MIAVDLIDARLISFLRTIGSQSREFGVESFVVGGAVRDWLLQIAAFDVDVMVVGNAPQFVEALYVAWERVLPNFPKPGEPKVFQKFGTVKLCFTQELIPGVSLIDFSSARKELYPTFGAEPEITLGATFEADMLRRDFAVNALALELNPDRFLKVVDVVGGVSDLKIKELRLLHEQSLLDDPARIIRGLRLVSRLGFTFERHTEDLMKRAVGQECLKQLPPFRLFDEMRKAFSEVDISKTIKEIYSWGILLQILPEAEPFDESSALMELSKILSVGKCKIEDQWIAVLFVLLRDEGKFLQVVKRGKLGRAHTEEALKIFNRLSAE